jgi:hypothetical protein
LVVNIKNFTLYASPRLRQARKWRKNPRPENTLMPAAGLDYAPPSETTNELTATTPFDFAQLRLLVHSASGDFTPTTPILEQG